MGEEMYVIIALLAAILVTNLVCGIILIWITRKPKYIALPGKPGPAPRVEYAGVMTPNGPLMNTEQRKPVCNDDETLAEREK